MSKFGYPDRFISSLSGPQCTPLYSNQNTKPIPESENKELKSEQDKLINTSGALMKAYENMTNKSKVRCGDLAEPLTKAEIEIAKAKGE